jgi:hypothetical protein
MGILDTDIETKADLRTDSGDHERFAHYAEKNEIMEAMINGTPIVALCGKIWVPSRDPKKFPICPTCKEIYDALFLS